jgi:hypothetical protein
MIFREFISGGGAFGAGDHFSGCGEVLAIGMAIKYGECSTTTLSPASLWLEATPPSSERSFASLPPRGGGIEGEGVFVKYSPYLIAESIVFRYGFSPHADPNHSTPRRL